MADRFAVLSDPPPMRPTPSTPPPSPLAAGKAPDPGQSKPKGSATRAAGNRFAVLNRFVDFTMGGLTRPEIAVWLILYRDTKRDGTARTSGTDLARRAGVGRRTAVRSVAKLEGRGLLKRVRRGGIGRGATVYRVISEPPK